MPQLFLVQRSARVLFVYDMCRCLRLRPLELFVYRRAERPRGPLAASIRRPYADNLTSQHASASELRMGLSIKHSTVYTTGWPRWDRGAEEEKEKRRKGEKEKRRG